MIGRLSNLNWDFRSADTRFAAHGFHSYPSKFIPQIAWTLICALSQPGDLVLDNFVGSGTTLLEAKRLGRKALGVDINPLACLISKVKTTSIASNLLEHEVTKTLARIKTRIMRMRATGLDDECDAAKMFRFRHIDLWFQPRVVLELSVIAEEIRQTRHNDVRDFLICAFSSIVRGVSNAHPDFGNLMRDKERPAITDTFERFRNKVALMKDGFYDHEYPDKQNSGVSVHLGDARDLSFISNQSIALIVTHPPYVASVPYAEYQKLSLLWLRAAFVDVLPFGAIQPSALDKVLIGGQRRRKDCLERFMSDMAVAVGEMARVLKPRRFCAIVIGNPILNGHKVFLNQSITQLAQSTSLELRVEIPRNKFRTTMGKMKKEFILIFRKAAWGPDITT